MGTFSRSVLIIYSIVFFYIKPHYRLLNVKDAISLRKLLFDTK